MCLVPCFTATILHMFYNYINICPVLHFTTTTFLSNSSVFKERVKVLRNLQDLQLHDTEFQTEGVLTLHVKAFADKIINTYLEGHRSPLTRHCEVSLTVMARAVVRYPVPGNLLPG